MYICAACGTDISIHALREEGDLAVSDDEAKRSDFYPRPPRGGRLHGLFASQSFLDISIHALREEGDGIPDVIREQIRNFYPRPPRGGRPPF